MCGKCYFNFSHYTLQVLQQLPKKKDIVKQIPLSSEQRKLYDNLKKHFTDTLKDEGLTS